MKPDLYLLADELRAIASMGLRWTKDGYDRERYQQLLHASARLVAVIEDSPVEAIYTQYSDNLAHFSPILCVEAAVFRDDKILLIQRRDDQKWAMPGGLAEVGESPAQAAERELWEEAGVHGRAAQLLGIYDTRFWPAASRMQLCIAQFLIDSNELPGLHTASGQASPLAESLDVGFFAEDQLPKLHVGFERRIPMAYKLWRGEVKAPFFDHEAFTAGTEEQEARIVSEIDQEENHVN
jgi:8-oxo-dGTP pyrophosphatase MutT (NUDIX family)